MAMTAEALDGLFNEVLGDDNNLQAFNGNEAPQASREEAGTAIPRVLSNSAKALGATVFGFAAIQVQAAHGYEV